MASDSVPFSSEPELASEDTVDQIDDGTQEYPGRFSFGSYEGQSLLDIAGGDHDDPEARKLAYASSSVIKFYPEWCQCVECLRPPASEAHLHSTCFDIIRSLCICPPAGPVARIFTFFLQFTLGWIFLWMLLKNVYGLPDLPSPAHPKGPIFALGVLEIVGLFFGIMFKCFSLPSLLGPLLLGIVLHNVDTLNLFRNFEGWNNRDCVTLNSGSLHHCNLLNAKEYSGHWIQPIRLISLALILTRAGLELSPKQLKKLKGVVPALAFIPCIVEACTCAAVTYALFHKNVDMSITMSFVAGFALSAVSPAVVVPGMLSLKRRRLGEAQGIPTLLIAASSIDDVLAISLYTVFLGLALPHEDTTQQWQDYAGGVIGIVTGIVHGVAVGMFLHFIPARDLKNLASFRLILLLVINVTTMLFYERFELLAGASSVGVLVASFIASFGWRSESHWKTPMGEIEHHLAHLWTLIVPLLFGTIGREIDFRGFTWVRVGKVIAVIMICLVVRCTVVFFITYFAKLNWKERLFCAASWIPKATVQAALAPLVISKIRIKINADPLKYTKYSDDGEIVVLIAVLAIVITAPLGAVLISTLGPILLKPPSEDFKSDLDEQFPDGDDPPSGNISLIPHKKEVDGLARVGSVEKMDGFVILGSAEQIQESEKVGSNEQVIQVVGVPGQSSSGDTDKNFAPIKHTPV